MVTSEIVPQMRSKRRISDLLFLFIPLTFLLTACFHDPFNLLREEVEFAVAESEHFVFHSMELTADSSASWILYEFPDGSTFDPRNQTQDESVALFLGRYEQMYRNFRDVFHCEPEEKIHIYLYTDPETKAMYGNNQGSDAWVDTSSMNGGKYTIHETYYFNSHELVHIFTSCMGNAPLFMLEGIASALGSGVQTFYEEPGVGILGLYYELPTLTLPDFPSPEVPYWTVSIEGLTHVLPTHKLAAMQMGLHTDAAHPLDESGIYPNLRPSHIISNSNVMTKDYSLVYTVGASFVHYLISAYGYQPFLLCYTDSSTNVFTGESILNVFLRHYGKSLGTLEDEWIAYLETEPAPHFTAPTYIWDFS